MVTVMEKLANHSDERTASKTQPNLLTKVDRHNGSGPLPSESELRQSAQTKLRQEVLVLIS